MLEERTQMSEKIMKKRKGKASDNDEMRPHYDFSKMTGGVRGKYVERYRAGINLVLLTPEVAAHFPDAESVNKALSALIPVSKRRPRRSRS